MQAHQLRHRLYKRDTYEALYGEIAGRMVSLDPVIALEMLHLLDDTAPAPCRFIIHRRVGYLIPHGALPSSFPPEVLSKIIGRRAHPRPAKMPTRRRITPDPYPAFIASRATTAQGSGQQSSL